MNNSHFPPVLYVAFSAAAATIFGLNAVSVASPALAYQLQSNLADMSTATTVYLLAEILFMCSLPVFLRKTSIENLLRWGCGGFAASSLFCFLSPSLDILIIARIAQGAFGGCLLPFLFNSIYPENCSMTGLTAMDYPLSSFLFLHH